MNSLQRSATWATTIAAWLLVVMLAGMILLHWVSGIAAARRDSASYDSSGSEDLVRWVTIALIIALMILSRWARGMRGFGFHWKQPRAPFARFVRATVLAVSIFIAAGLLNRPIAALLGWQFRPVTTSWDELTIADRAMRALHAGLSEETLDIAIPVGVAFAALSVLNRDRRMTGRPEWTTDSLWRWALLAGGIGLITRVIDHLYQGGASSLLALAWGSGLLALFAIYRSVLPLMLAHFIMDAVIVGNSALIGNPAGYAALALALAGVFALTFMFGIASQRTGTLSASPRNTGGST
ncbi:hypothetical protein ITJ57_18815 [Plantibacter sp. VKM Ac-2880]|uniref:hypothetical protein n=1 Tax=Plantibacter sp. VKM Ac-2880 TaxID=2783827 RepID=UPI00188DCFE6|nr:hypothetical protein [Plantibacter sp. VKM Ac-2880]MBF4570826.1 hypothetical protein [Plantibacter sp. VKM Ac-2880]